MSLSHHQNSWFATNVLILMLACSIMLAAQSPEVASIQLYWQLRENEYDSKPQFLAELFLENNGPNPLAASGWKLFFNLRYHSPNLKSLNPDFEIQHVNGELFQIVPTSRFHGLAVGQKVSIPFTGRGKIANYQDVPSGFFWVDDANPVKALVVKNPKIIAENTRLPEIDAVALYDQQTATADIDEKVLPKVFPTPVQYKETGGKFNLDPNVTIEEGDFKNEGRYLRGQLNKMFSGRTVKKTTSGKIQFRKATGAAESYSLSVTANSIVISASDGIGIFYGIQSLQSLLPPDAWTGKSTSIIIPTVEVSDSPRFPWRAFMLDVSRNFQSKEKILRLIDVMSLYKLNVFHFHLNDDEGWRIEIPGLPELTTVGATRGFPFEDGSRLQPSYGSGADPSSPAGSGYYSRQDFVEILKYATDRHVTVIPEIESPGHARAAVKAMEFRYNRLLKEGKQAEADRYRLHDPEDKSKYIGAQSFNDNVMNAALPSTYTFIEKVVDELQAMYREAGAPIQFVHMGGDEVPEGAWAGSPAVQDFMKHNPSVKTLDDLWTQFFVRVKNMLKQKRLSLYGWEELVMAKGGAEESRKISADAEFIRDGGLVDAWWTGNGHEDVSYRIANAGYKTVLTCFDYFYFDLSNHPSFDEPGDAWVGYLDIKKTFAFIPFDFYRSSTTDKDGVPYPPNYFQNKEKLNQEAYKNIIGIQGALWGENLNAPELMEYQTMPRLMAVAERAWTKDPQWSTMIDREQFDRSLNRDWSVFANVLGKRELPKLDFYLGGYGYRVPPPGAKMINGEIVANVLFPGFAIRYTTDGSEPTLSSKLYSSPIAEKGLVRLKCFSRNGRGSLETRIDHR